MNPDYVQGMGANQQQSCHYDAMTSHSITLSRTVNASPEQVWCVFTYIPAAADTLSGVEGIEMLSEPPYGVGTRWRETRTMFGKKATEEMWVTGAEGSKYRCRG